MQLPNKLYSYKNSTLVLIPKVLSVLKDSPVPLFELYDKLKPELNDATDFLSVMDCLYALRAADINDEGEVFICPQRCSHQCLWNKVKFALRFDSKRVECRAWQRGWRKLYRKILCYAGNRFCLWRRHLSEK